MRLENYNSFPLLCFLLQQKTFLAVIAITCTMLSHLFLL
jgi:hypothetical protein